MFATGVCALMILFSCNTPPVFDELYTFKNQSWQRIEEDIPFEVEITDDSRRYDIDIPIRYGKNYSHQHLEIGIIILSPSGQQNILERKIYLVDEKHQPRGIEAEGARDYVFRLFDGYKFNETGTFRIEIQNLTGNKMFLTDLHHIGLTISRAKKQHRDQE